MSEREPFPAVCECHAPKFALVTGKLRCMDCHGWKDDVKQKQVVEPSACPNCGSTAAPWESRWGTKCQCGHIATKDDDVSGQTHTPVQAVKIRELESAGPSHAVLTNRVSMTI